MPRFRKKPVEIEAIQLTPETFRDVIAFVPIDQFGAGGQHDDGRAYVSIRTLEGTMRADEGDWIIRGVQGEFYPCKPDIFAATYEPVPAATEAAELETTARMFSALHRSAEDDVTRVIDLYERWVKAGPPPLGTSLARWWDARLAELHEAIRPSEEEPPTGQTTVEGEPICTCTYGERCPNCRD